MVFAAKHCPGGFPYPTCSDNFQRMCAMYPVSLVSATCFTKVKLIETVVTQCCPFTLIFHSQELILPLTITATKFEKLRRWEEPYMTVSFLAFASTIIFRLVYTP